MKNALEIRDLRVSFGTRKSKVEVVSGISLCIPEGKIVGVVGESGCGKTVTALSIMRLIPDPPGKITGGDITFDGVNLLELSESDIRSLRGNRISMIFQEPISSLNPVFPVGDQIGEAIRTHLNLSKKEERGRIIELLKLVGIPAPENRLNSYPHELSGGMCQRVMIAMALACHPQLLIADEPTTALDVTIQAGILDLINELKERMGMSVLLITHDLGIVAEVADYVYVMYAGKIVEHASVNDLFDSPSHPYTRGLMNSIPRLDDHKQKLNAIPGTIPSPNEFSSACRFQDRCPYVIDKCRINEPTVKQVNSMHYAACFRSEELIQGL
jgi:oligopeptide/dipeptide ABC transporter ATP-binding protein